MLNHHDKFSTTASDARSVWTADHVAKLRQGGWPAPAIITAEQGRPLLDGVSLWDIWPVQHPDGTIAAIAGGSLWIILSAPRRHDPDLRHEEARLRLLFRTGTQWIDCGHLLPDGFSPGSREWSGSTRFDPATGEVTLWFTAAGRRGRTIAPDFEQRLFQTMGTLDLGGAVPRIVGWRDLTPSVCNDGRYYADLAVNQGVPGHIKGFRDPYWFRDPADGCEYLLFTGSKPAAASQSSHDGVVGIAARESDGSYVLLPPLIDADGLANELERPHVFVHDGQYYLFWSSQAHIFAPDVPAGPTGLYGMVAPSLFGPYQPLNGSGLVLANPPAEPRQAYAWQVIPSAGPLFEIVSFVDLWGVGDEDLSGDPERRAKHFGGTIAPFVSISLAGATSRIEYGGV